MKGGRGCGMLTHMDLRLLDACHTALGFAPAGVRSGHDDADSRAPPPLRASVRQLMILRSVAVAGQAAAIATSWALGVTLPLAAMALVVGALALLNLVMWVRLRSARESSYAEIAANIALDLAGFTLLLALSGGAGNPFSLIYVLHCVLMALLLPPLAASVGTAVVIACYVMLGMVGLPLEMAYGETVPSGLLTFGQWVSMALTAGFTAYFVARIVRTLREHDRLLDEAVRCALRDDAVLRIGSLAAGAAHELTRPLATASVLAGDIARYAETPQARHDASLLAAQIALCRGVIDHFTAAAGHARAAGGGRERLDLFLESIAATCRTLHPRATIVSDWSGIIAPPDVLGEHSLKQALLTLLGNAVDASPRHVRFSGTWDGEALRVSILDDGPGVSAENVPKLGRAFFTTKAPGKGAGLGLVVAARAIERLGGNLRWQSSPGEGTRAEVVLPLAHLIVGALHGTA
jgi:two-component system sensor histidine kinase RegB